MSEQSEYPSEWQVGHLSGAVTSHPDPDNPLATILELRIPSLGVTRRLMVPTSQARECAVQLEELHLQLNQEHELGVNNYRYTDADTVEMKLDAEGSSDATETVLFDAVDLSRVLEHRWKAVVVDDASKYNGHTLAVTDTGLYIHSVILPGVVLVSYRDHHYMDARRVNLKGGWAKAPQRAPRPTRNKLGVPGLSDSQKYHRYEVWYRVRCPHTGKERRRKKIFPYTDADERSKLEAFEQAVQFKASVGDLVES